ncbi:aspartate aminotransferase family protein [Veronia nyctiphanis]|uniref:Aspartate aminotransferase family protein n=1 Tax=Veronia nyctiphanis TaxID=1278244 RepID=A0A4Q0YU42_9GAMM|nr:aspartate aminotransferase family protein [Veronia nyctiphanis]RXJ74812.1 aspartate aminotransferase family protein [Veronia nyctiphanis]
MAEHNLAYNTESLQQQDNQHYLHPFSDHKSLREQGARMIVKADGVYIWDSDGNKILDGMAGLWCTNIGYGQKSLANVAFEQMNELPYYNSFFQCAHPPAVELAKEIAELAPPHMNQVFFTGSGSESNDTVLRMVRHYWNLKGKPEKFTIIGRHNGYHGSTVAGASLGGMKPMHQQGGLPIPGIHHIPQPYWFGEGGDLSPEEFGIQAAQELEKAIQDIGEDKVAAFIAEPIQGAGGVVIPPDTYWPEIKKILAKHDILLIVDEVICGFGRTGEWFGSQYFGLEPDFMPIAKGLTSGYIPMGGVIVSDRVAGVFEQEGGEFYHGYTYSGHPVAAAVARENIRLIKEKGLVEYVKNDIGPYLQQAWKTLGDHPLVGETRGLGLLAALEVVQEKEGRVRFDSDLDVGGMCRNTSVSNGLVMRAVGDTLIISPPMIISRDEVDELITKARKTLDLTMESLKQQGLY